MKSIYLPEERMLPRVRLARCFTASAQTGITKETPIRTAQGYEAGIYLTDGGSITVNAHRHALHRLDVRLLRPGDKVSSEPDYSCISVYFDLGDITAHYHNELLDAIPSVFPGHEKHLLLFQHILESFPGEATGDIAKMNAAMLRLLAGFHSQRHSPANDCPAVAACVGHMKKNLQHKITLDELGALTGYSPQHILRMFKSDVQRTPHAYLTMLRVAHARELLADTDIPLNEVAESCGFASISHFQTIFKRQAGLSPSRYRRVAQLL